MITDGLRDVVMAYHKDSMEAAEFQRQCYALMRANGATDAKARALTDVVAACLAGDVAALHRSENQFIKACE